MNRVCGKFDTRFSAKKPAPLFLFVASEKSIKHRSPLFISYQQTSTTSSNMKVAPFSLLLALLSSSGTPSAVMANDSDGGVAGRKLDSSGSKGGKGGSCDLALPEVRFQRDGGFANIAAGLCDTLGTTLNLEIVGEEQGLRSGCAVQLTQLALQVLGDLFSVDTATIAAADDNEDGYLETIEMMPILGDRFGDLCPEEVYVLGASFFGPRPLGKTIYGFGG